MAAVELVAQGDAALFEAIAPIGGERLAERGLGRVHLQADGSGVRLLTPDGSLAFGLPWRVVAGVAAGTGDRVELTVVSPSRGAVAVPLTLVAEDAEREGRPDAVLAAERLAAIRRRALGGDISTEDARAQVDALGVPAMPPAALRSLLWLLLIPLGGVIGLAVGLVPRMHGSQIPAFVGMGIGALFGVILVITKWQAGVRLAVVGALQPAASLVHALRSRETDAAFERLGGVSPETIGTSFVLAVGEDGVRVYSGIRDARLVFDVEWPDVLGVSESVVGIGQKTYAGLTLRIRVPDGTVDLPFAVVGRGANLAKGRRLDSVRELLLAGRGSASTPSSPTGSYLTPPRRPMLSGVSSASLSRVLRITSSLTAVPVAGYLLAQVARLVVGDDALPIAPLYALLVVLIVIVAANLLVVLLLSRRTKAETAAGYTLSRTGDLSLDQLDPATGFVLRPAHAEQLTREAERAALTRVRSLA